MIDRETIEHRYKNDVEAAEAWREADPERYATEINKATTRRADSYSELAGARETEARAATLAQARTTALAAFPLADPDAVLGDDPEAIRASAERSHRFVEGKQQEAQRATLVARRPFTREAWTGNSTSARPGIPGGELRGEDASVLQQHEKTVYDRTAEVLRESRQPGTLRRYSDDALTMLRSQDPEAQAFADYRLLHPQSGLSDAALRARAEGTAQFSAQPSGVPEGEDKKG